MEKTSNGLSFGGFQSIAMKSLKSKNSPEDSLSSLFSCVESLDAARVSLSEYATAISDGEKQGRVSSFIEALKKIESDLLGMAQEKVTADFEPEKDEPVEEFGPMVARRR